MMDFVGDATSCDERKESFGKEAAGILLHAAVSTVGS